MMSWFYPQCKKSKGKTFVFHKADNTGSGYCHSGVTALVLRLPGSNYAWAQKKELCSCVELGILKLNPT